MPCMAELVSIINGTIEPTEAPGSRIQFKENPGVGFSYKF
jgi:hypothetical protein